MRILVVGAGGVGAAAATGDDRVTSAQLDASDADAIAALAAAERIDTILNACDPRPPRRSSPPRAPRARHISTWR